MQSHSETSYSVSCLYLVFMHRFWRRVQVFSQYLYYFVLEKFSPNFSLERPRLRAESGFSGLITKDRTSSIEFHLETNANTRGEFVPLDPAAEQLATRVASKFKTTKCSNCDEPLMPVIQVVNSDDPLDFVETSWCPSCDHLQYSVMPPKSWITQWYGTRWDLGTSLETKLETRHPTYRYCRRLAPYLPNRKLKILDVGAGFGDKTSRFKEAGHEIYCTELTGARADYLKSHVTDHVFFGTLDDSSVQEALRHHAPFDLIFTYHVVEHVYNPRHELQLLHDIAADDAIFYMAIPELYKEGIFQAIYSMAHISSFSRLSARKLMQQIGFNPVVAKDDPFQYYSNYCQYLIGRKAAPNETVQIERNRDSDKFIRYLCRALKLDQIAKLDTSAFSYKNYGRSKLTYRVTEESKTKCSDIASHLPIKFYHQNLPLFWKE